MLSFAETFFPSALHSQLPQFHRTDNSFGYCVLGATQSGKSSFAFQAVVNTLQRNSGALLICHESAQSSSDICTITPMTSLSPSQTDRLEISFVQSHSECRGLLSSIGTSLETTSSSGAGSPSMIFVEADRFVDAFDCYEIGKTLATLDNTLSYMRSAHQGSTALFVLVLPLAIVPPHVALKGGMSLFSLFPFCCSPSTSMITLVLDSSSKQLLLTAIAPPLVGVDALVNVQSWSHLVMTLTLRMTSNGFQIV